MSSKATLAGRARAQAKATRKTLRRLALRNRNAKTRRVVYGATK